MFQRRRDRYENDGLFAEEYYPKGFPKNKCLK
jgi:hypothetical protein